jgi:hypothetical protein
VQTLAAAAGDWEMTHLARSSSDLWEMSGKPMGKGGKIINLLLYLGWMAQLF